MALRKSVKSQDSYLNIVRVKTALRKSIKCHDNCLNVVRVKTARRKSFKSHENYLNIVRVRRRHTITVEIMELWRSIVYVYISQCLLYTQLYNIYIYISYLSRRHIVTKNQCNKSVCKRRAVPGQGFTHLHGRKKERFQKT